jgi:hypothetical protein
MRILAGCAKVRAGRFGSCRAAGGPSVLGGIASPSRGRGIVREAERVCRSSDWNTSVSLARPCGARGRAPSRSGAGQRLRP